jgi:hypothetical protein
MKTFTIKLYSGCNTLGEIVLGTVNTQQQQFVPLVNGAPIALEVVETQAETTSNVLCITYDVWGNDPALNKSMWMKIGAAEICIPPTGSYFCTLSENDEQTLVFSIDVDGGIGFSTTVSGNGSATNVSTTTRIGSFAIPKTPIGGAGPGGGKEELLMLERALEVHIDKVAIGEAVIRNIKEQFTAVLRGEVNRDAGSLALDAEGRATAVEPAPAPSTSTR